MIVSATLSSHIYCYGGSPGLSSLQKTEGVEMKHKWEVDNANVVEANFGAFGKKVITVNGREAHNQGKSGTKNPTPFEMPDGRSAVISINHQFVGQPNIELRVDGRVILPSGKDPIKCIACGATAKPYDHFCEKCGHAMPSAEDWAHQKRVKDATGAIGGLAILFVISGAIMFFVTKSQSAVALLKLQSMNPDSIIPTPINGVTYTVAALRHQILWETWSVLIVNLILAAVMAGLFIWGKRAPLAAVLVATATYLVVIVTNAIIDPKTIGQGIYLKIIIVALLVKGIRSALLLRTENA